MGKEVISEEEWENGKSREGNEEKELEIMKVLKSGERISSKGISERSGIKWVYSSLVNLVKKKKVERKKIGKKYYYRKV